MDPDIAEPSQCPFCVALSRCREVGLIEVDLLEGPVDGVLVFPPRLNQRRGRGSDLAHGELPIFSPAALGELRQGTNGWRR